MLPWPGRHCQRLSAHYHPGPRTLDSLPSLFNVGADVFCIVPAMFVTSPASLTTGPTSPAPARCVPLVANRACAARLVVRQRRCTELKGNNRPAVPQTLRHRPLEVNIEVLAVSRSPQLETHRIERRKAPTRQKELGDIDLRLRISPRRAHQGIPLVVPELA